MTLLEVLVVIAVVAILVALILPALSAAREAYRRMKCIENLKQIGIAAHGYLDVFGCLPPGRVMAYDPRYAGSNPPCTSTMVDRSFLVRILPQIEQAPLFNSINASTIMTGAENYTAFSVVVSTYSCPSDPDSGRPRTLPSSNNYQLPEPIPPGTTMVFASYSANFGSYPTSALATPKNHCIVNSIKFDQNNGLLNDNAAIAPSQITDGFSNTILASEKGTALYSNFYPDDSVEQNRYGWWVNGNLGDTLLTGFYPPNAYRILGPAALRLSASSYHPGGINVLLMDGSARFVKDSIDSWPIDLSTRIPSGMSYAPQGWYLGATPLGIWQKLATRAGGEAFSNTNY